MSVSETQTGCGMDDLPWDTAAHSHLMQLGINKSWPCVTSLISRIRWSGDSVRCSVWVGKQPQQARDAHGSSGWDKRGQWSENAGNLASADVLECHYICILQTNLRCLPVIHIYRNKTGNWQEIINSVAASFYSDTVESVNAAVAWC